MWLELSNCHEHTLTYDGITLPESITQRKTHSTGYGTESRNVSFNSQDLEMDFILDDKGSVFHFVQCIDFTKLVLLFSNQAYFL